MKHHFTVILVGGDGRARLAVPDDLELRRYGSRKYRGNGSIQSAVAAIEAGAVDGVVLLVRWLGHSAFHALRAAARRAGIPCRIVPGGESAALRAARDLAGGE